MALFKRTKKDVDAEPVFLEKLDTPVEQLLSEVDNFEADVDALLRTIAHRKKDAATAIRARAEAIAKQVEGTEVNVR